MDNNSSEAQQIQILKNIEKLQNMEKELYKELESNSVAGNSSSIINRINQLSQIRVSLFSSLNYNYQSVQKNVNTARTELVELLTVVGIVEEELNNAKKQLNQMYEIKHEKMRMVEINTYYGKQYRAQGSFLKLVILVSVLLLILAILRKKGLIMDSLYTVLLGFILVLGGFFIIRRLLDISKRDNMNYDAYDWKYNPDNVIPTVYEYDKAKLKGLIEDIDASISNFNGLDCFGGACCSEGMKYDAAIKKCIIGVAPETFISGQLTKECFKTRPMDNRLRGGNNA